MIHDIFNDAGEGTGIYLVFFSPVLISILNSDKYFEITFGCTFFERFVISVLTPIKISVYNMDYIASFIIGLIRRLEKISLKYPQNVAIKLNSGFVFSLVAIFGACHESVGREHTYSRHRQTK